MQRKTIFNIFVFVYILNQVYGRRTQTKQSTKVVDPSPQHNSNYAIIVSTSRYYFNYRHSANALSIYKLLKTRGNFPDSHIILMLAEDYTCDARNPFKNTMFTESYGSFRNGNQEIYNDPTKNLSPLTDVEVDYSGDEVNVDTFTRVLLGRHDEHELPSRKLPPLTNSSNIFIFMTGHGGDGFFKFHDLEEISTPDFQSIFQQMHILQRYHSILFITDTCQAFTLSEGIGEGSNEDENIAPNVISVGSSLRDENSYAHHADRTLGISVIDRFSFQLDNYLKSRKWDQTTWNQVFQSMTWGSLRSHVGVRGSIHGRDVKNVKVSEFFEDAQFRNIDKKNRKKIGGSDDYRMRAMEWNEHADLKRSNITKSITDETDETCQRIDELQDIEDDQKDKDQQFSEKDYSTFGFLLQKDMKLCLVTCVFFCWVHLASKTW